MKLRIQQNILMASRPFLGSAHEAHCPLNTTDSATLTKYDHRPLMSDEPVSLLCEIDVPDWLHCCFKAQSCQVAAAIAFCDIQKIKLICGAETARLPLWSMIWEYLSVMKIWHWNTDSLRESACISISMQEATNHCDQSSIVFSHQDCVRICLKVPLQNTPCYRFVVIHWHKLAITSAKSASAMAFDG